MNSIVLNGYGCSSVLGINKKVTKYYIKGCKSNNASMLKNVY